MAKKRTGWRITSYLMVVLTVFLSLAALLNISTSLNGSDPAESMGRVIGSIALPVAAGFFTRYCFRKSRS